MTVRFVALGDSITVGLGDPLPDRTWRGWAALLAEALGPPGGVAFHNLAQVGALSRDVAHDQLPRALALEPTIAAVLVGVNDTLRGTFAVDQVGHNLRAVVDALIRAGAVVLTARLPDPGRMFTLPGSLARPLARRVTAVNAIADGLAARFSTVHFDADNHADTYQPAMWSVDRLHPSERGHRMLARAFAELLAARGFPVHAVPGAEPTNRPPSRVAQAAWLATRGTKWVLDRSTDLLPSLIALAAAEWWHQRRGTARRLDEHLRHEVARVLAGLDPASAACDDILTFRNGLA